jgi:hypothetical protein
VQESCQIRRLTIWPFPGQHNGCPSRIRTCGQGNRVKQGSAVQYKQCKEVLPVVIKSARTVHCGQQVVDRAVSPALSGPQAHRVPGQVALPQGVQVQYSADDLALNAQYVAWVLSPHERTQCYRWVVPPPGPQYGTCQALRYQLRHASRSGCKTCTVPYFNTAVSNTKAQPNLICSTTCAGQAVPPVHRTVTAVNSSPTAEASTTTSPAARR